MKLLLTSNCFSFSEVVHGLMHYNILNLQMNPLIGTYTYIGLTQSCDL